MMNQNVKLHLKQFFKQPSQYWSPNAITLHSEYLLRKEHKKSWSDGSKLVGAQIKHYF